MATFSTRPHCEEGSTGRIGNACYWELDLVGKISTGRVKQCLCCWIVEVCLGDERDTRVLVLGFHSIAKLIYHCLEAVITHLERVLNNQGVYRSVLEARDQAGLTHRTKSGGPSHQARRPLSACSAPSPPCWLAA